MAMQMPPDSTVVTERPVSMAEMGGAASRGRDLLIQDSRTHADVRGDRRCLSVIALGLAPAALGRPLDHRATLCRTLARLRRMWLTKLASPRFAIVTLRRMGDGSGIYHRGRTGHLS